MLILGAFVCYKIISKPNIYQNQSMTWKNNSLYDSESGEMVPRLEDCYPEWLVVRKEIIFSSDNLQKSCAVEGTVCCSHFCSK